MIEWRDVAFDLFIWGGLALFAAICFYYFNLNGRGHPL